MRTIRALSAWQSQLRKAVKWTVVFLLVALPVCPLRAQNPLKFTSWYQNAPDANALLGVTAIRLGCSSDPASCEGEIAPFANSQDVQRIYLSIQLFPNTSATYAGEFSRWGLANPVLFAIAFDDLVGQMEDRQGQNGVSDPGAIVTDTLNAIRAANPNIKLAVTMYEDQLGSPLLGDSNLPASTRAGVDYVELYVHFREDGPNYALYIQQTQTLFPNAKIIAGVYAFDRIDYLPCSPHGVPCTTQQEESLFQQLFQLQLSELQQGIVDQIEFYPGYFGLEAQWPEWNGPRRCQPARLPQCISNTLAMHDMVYQDLTASFGPPGPLTSLSPRPLVFPVQNISTSSGESTVTLNNPGTATLNIGSISISGANASDFSQRNSCAATLAAGANCPIQVTFTPFALGVRAAQLVVTDNARRSPHAMDLQGIASSPSDPQALLSPTALNFQGQTVKTTSPRLEILLSNPGGGALGITSIVISGSSAAQFAQTNNCGSSVAAGGNCTVNVTFTPATADNQSAQLVITDNAVGSPHVVTLTGIGNAQAAPTITLSHTALSFTSQNVKIASPPQSVTIGNPGAVAIPISGISISGTNASDFSQTNNCGSSLAAGNSCSVAVTFTPSAAGPRSAQVLIADTANGSPQAITLSGTGAAGVAPVVSITPGSLTFTSQNLNSASAPANLNLANTGNATLTLSSIAISGANAADFSQTNTCGGSVAAGASCSISVVFKPAAAGSRSAQIAITDNAPGSPQQIALSGTAAASAGTPAVTLSPISLTFPSQSVNSPSGGLPVTLTNSGNALLTISSIAISGANAADFSQTNTCAGSVAAGANCSISVVFKPAAAGSRSAQIAITDNATGSPQQIALSGNGTASAGGPVVTLSPTSLTFPSQSVNTPGGGLPVTLTNSGNAVLTISGIAISGANATDFSQTNTCGASVAAGANCSISVVFTPTAPGSRSAQISITDNAGGSPQQVSLSGTGAAATSPDFALSLTPQSATLAAGQTSPFTLSVSPSGGFSQPVSFACAGLPAGASCTFSPPTVTPSGTSSGKTTLTVATTASSGILPNMLRVDWPLLFRIAVSLSVLSLLLYFHRRRTVLACPASWARQPALLFVLILSLVTSVAGCANSSSSPPPKIGGTPAGTYSITVTASSGTLSHQVALSLTVN